MADTVQYDILSDEELFSLVQQNDQGAFSILYSRYSRNVYSYCLRMIGEEAVAKDIFHDVMITVFESRHSFKGGSFAKWLFTIARTRSLNAIRNRKRTEDITEMESWREFSETEEVEEKLFINELLHKGIARLPEELREALILRHFEDYSYAEIAEMTGISLSLAKVRVFRAIKMIQKKLSPYLREML
jgi:RNA polymerase sigma factor (sigma-70 family)